jgi:hypothetical protein
MCKTLSVHKTIRGVHCSPLLISMIKSGEAAMSKENKIYKKLRELVYPMADGLNNEVS